MYEILSQVSAWSVIVPLLAGLALYKYLKKESKLILAIVIIATAPQLIHSFLPKSTTEIVSYNIYTVIEFFVYYFLFYHKITNKKVAQFFKIMLGVYIIAAFYFLFQFGFRSKFINWLSVMNGFAFLIMIGLYLYETFIFDSGDLSKSNSFFWYTIGILLYAVCTAPVYSLWHRIKPDSPLTNLWNLQNFFNILTYLLFTYGFILDKRSKLRNVEF